MPKNDKENTGAGKHGKRIASQVAHGRTYREIAASLGVSYSTVARVATRPAVKRLISKYRDRLIGAGLGLLCKNFRSAVKDLVLLSKYGSPVDNVRLSACRTLIESVLKVREHTELKDRMDQMGIEIRELRGATESDAVGTGGTSPSP